MGTGHDDFTERAHVDATDLKEEQIANRQFLQGVMLDAGFSIWPYEWWHFDFLMQYHEDYEHTIDPNCT